jgi:hypothetical protein
LEVVRSRITVAACAPAGAAAAAAAALPLSLPAALRHIVRNEGLGALYR